MVSDIAPSHFAQAFRNILISASIAEETALYKTREDKTLRTNDETLHICNAIF